MDYCLFSQYYEIILHLYQHKNQQQGRSKRAEEKQQSNHVINKGVV